MMQVIKRDGSKTEFNKFKIQEAIMKAMVEVDELDYHIAVGISESIERAYNIDVSVEDIERLVVKSLYVNDFDKTADAYSEYKAKRKMLRATTQKRELKFLDETFISEYKHKLDPFKNELGKFVYYRTYSRPVPQENRREYWWETVLRVVEFNFGLQLEAMKRQGVSITDGIMNELKDEAKKVYDLMFHLKLFPSGRSLWVAGTPTSYSSAISNFNCSFVTMDDFDKFSEIFMVLMLGTGVGLSVERLYVNKLPRINSKIEIISRAYEPVAKQDRLEHTSMEFPNKHTAELVIGDSRSGWSEAIRLYFNIISSKQYADVNYIFINYNNIRGAGERIKGFGGFASGHEAMKQMFEKIDKMFKGKANRIQWYKLKPIDCLDISTIIAENVVSGGTRRSAEIVFCDPDETDVLQAKSNLYYQDDHGNWVSNTNLLHRMLSNNTVLYPDKPSREQLTNHFNVMRVSGEPAFGNLKEMKRRREDVQGGNPCFEILLRDRGVCNLTEVNMMGFVDDEGNYNISELLEAQRLSARIGYRMATIELELHKWNLTNEEDRLTGCSLTGVMDFCNATNTDNDRLGIILRELKRIAKDATRELSSMLNMNDSKLVTAVKPSGTISQVAGVSSGVHFSHSPYYIRRVRVSARDPLAQAMVASGFKWNPEVGQSVENHQTKVFEFPVKAPKGKTKYDVSAIEQLELYKLIMENYVDHNASNTIHVREEEWKEVEQWVYDNWDSVVGVTFLSLDDSFYQLLPYEAITENEYNEMLKNQPRFSANILSRFENFAEEFDLMDDTCSSGVCPTR